MSLCLNPHFFTEMIELENTSPSTHKNKFPLVDGCVFFLGEIESIYCVCSTAKVIFHSHKTQSDETFKGHYFLPLKDQHLESVDHSAFYVKRSALTCFWYPFQPISIFIFWWNKLFFLQKWQNWKTHTQNKHVSLGLVGVCFFR